MVTKPKITSKMINTNMITINMTNTKKITKK